MNRTTFALIVAAACAATPASALTIVQYDSDYNQFGFKGFDSSLGYLNSVTLDVTVSKYRGWMVKLPSDVAAEFPVTWSVDGIWRLGPDNKTNGVPLELALTGSGVETVDADWVSGGNAIGYFSVAVSGSGNFTLNREAFLGLQSFQRVILDGADRGYLDATGSDTTLAGPDGAVFQKIFRACQGPIDGYPEDFCGSTLYKVTYDYTPGATGPVPEPASWAMMIAGFGLVGGIMRRKAPHQIARMA